MKKVAWIAFTVFVWLLKWVLWLPLMTIYIHEGRVQGDMRPVYPVVVILVWPVFGLLLWFSELLLLPTLIIGGMYLTLGIFGVLALSWADEEVEGQPA